MADTVLTDLKIHDFDSLAQMSQYESEIGDNDLVLTPDLSCRLPLLTPMWFDHIANDVSWLRADTFSWHSGDVYKAVYEHLANDSVKLYAWASGAAIYYTLTETPAVGDNVYSSNEHDDPSQIESVDNGTITFDDPRSGVQKVATRDATGDSNSFVLGIGLKTDTIDGITITYYTAEDGHKICLPDQESNLAALYESTGVAWYYILDTENKQFKLPRTKWGFTGLRDSVGGYVEPGLPNITAKFRTGSWKTDAVSASTSGAATQTNGGNAKAYEGGTNAYTYVDTAIDANRSSAIYGASDTVQPPATQMYLYFWVGAFDQTATEQTAGLNAEMFNDLNAHKIIEVQNPTAENGYTWYRKYADGWVEQGGLASQTTSSASVGSTVVLPVEMSDGNYFITFCNYSNTTGNSSTAYVQDTAVTNVTATGFTFCRNYNSPKRWEVKGMAA